jgi:hypothetical protein
VLKVQCGAQTAIYTGPNSPVTELKPSVALELRSIIRRREVSSSSGNDEVKGESDERQAFDVIPPSAAIQVKRALEPIPVDQI